MIFNSINFLIFIIIVYCLYIIFKHTNQNLLLLLSSYVFYASWDIRFLFVLVSSTIINYCCGILITKPHIGTKQRITVSLWMILSCLVLITPQWSKAAASFQSVSILESLNILFSSDTAWIITTILTLTVIIINLLLSRIHFPDKYRPQIFLGLAVLTNLGSLLFFKYFNFFIDNIEWFLRELYLNPSTFHLNICLPIGISFYIFKCISYTVDIYNKRISPELNYVAFAVFISFFPALLAGPIDRASNLLSQLSQKRHITTGQNLRGLHLIVYGLFKKIVIADSVIRTVSSVYDSTGYASWLDIVAGTVLFTLQIYCDFSGYTDIARGIAKLFGFDLMINFNSPYFSQGPREFWSRWHISLSTWLRDYLYIPLGGSRNGTLHTYRNLMVTMLLGGLWHGASWNFVLWGFYHGILLCLDKAIRSVDLITRASQKLWIRLATGCLFFIFTCYGWLLFRAPSFERIGYLSSNLFADFGNMSLAAARPKLSFAFGLPVFIIIECLERFRDKPFYETIHLSIWTALYAMIIFCLAIGLSSESTQFIYMAF